MKIPGKLYCKKNVLISTVLFCAFIFEGCAHFYYLPGNVNVPLFTEKNEFNVSIARGGGSISSGTDVQTAISLTGNFAVMANYMSSNYSFKDPGDENVAKLNNFEGAAGYFKPFSRFWVFEIFGGLGAGSEHHEYYAFPEYTYRGKADMKFIKSFVQPSLGMTFNAMDIALTSGFTRLKFNNINNYIDPNSQYYDEVESIAVNRESYLFEPAITVRTGWKFVKMQFQYLRSFNLTNDNLIFEPGKVSLGVCFSLSKKNLKQ